MSKILIVDDNPDFCATLRGILEDGGHFAKSALCEKDALEAVVEGEFDFALVDVRLHDKGESDESGLSLALALRSLNPQIHTIILSRFLERWKSLRSLWYRGIVDYIAKESKFGEQILKVIEKYGEVDQLKYKVVDITTRLSLTLLVGQPLLIRAQGCYVCSSHSWKILRLDTARYARRIDIAKNIPSQIRFQTEQIGRDLWNDVFANHPESKSMFAEARKASPDQLLSIRFETPREFLQLPLEFLRTEQPDDYLVLQHPMSRFLYEVSPKREPISPALLTLTEKLRVLLIASNTQSDTPRLMPIPGADEEIEHLRNYLSNNQDYIKIKVDVIPTKEATYDRVEEELKNKKYDIIHYAGHGFYNANSPEESCLYFWSQEGGTGKVVPMNTAKIKYLLQRSAPRLVFFSSCYGSASGSKTDLLDDDFLGLADAAAQAGIPSILGYRWAVSDEGALNLSLSFYQHLLRQGSPEVALWNARCELAARDMNDPTWLSPILIHQE